MPKGRHIERKDLKVGMIVIQGDEEIEGHATCWKIREEKVPMRITRILGINTYFETLDGVKNSYCDSSNVDLYLWEEEKMWETIDKDDVFSTADGYMKVVVGRLNEVIFYRDAENSESPIVFEGWRVLHKGSCVISQEAPPETTEVLGKKYNVSDVRKAVKGLKEVE